MANSRKDKRGRVLRHGESQRSSDGRYVYTYTDQMGKRHYIYAKDLMTLREKEKELVRYQLDGLADYGNRKVTLNYAFDRYILTKSYLREQTRTNYKYTYDRYVRETFGQRMISDIRYSDVKSFYLHLIKKYGIKVTTLDNVHCVLHPVFDMAVRDDIIRKNPSDRVMAELKKMRENDAGVRHALTPEQQKAFLDFVELDPIYEHWTPIFIILFGTGMRVGECLGLCWQDIDFDKKTIKVRRSLIYRKMESGKCENRISKVKTDSGNRTIPMVEKVYQALQDIYEDQLENGFNETEIDGVDGFVFMNNYGNVLSAQSLNKAIRRVYELYNEQEIISAARDKREANLIPHFTCHHIRHTFCSRLCEAETNLKVIQSIMGHSDIRTTMDIYAEVNQNKEQEVIAALDNDNAIFL